MSDTGQDSQDLQVCKQVKKLERALIRLAEIISLITERLSSVLRHEPEAPTEDKKQPELLVPLAEDLLQMVNGINNQRSRIGSILTRLEL